MVAVAIVGAGIAAGVGTAVAGGEAASGASKAASTEAQAQQQAIQEEEAQGNAAAQLQVPYEQLGAQTAGQLQGELAPGGALSTAPSLTSADIAQMPGYQFTLQQGLLSTQNAQTAQGLGVSGNALAAASQYATGLAASNYQNYFSDYWANQNNRFNMLYNTTQLGANAATNAGNQMVQVGGQVGNTLTTSAANIGSAQATAAADTAQGIAGAASNAQGIASGLGSLQGSALLANALVGTGQSGSTIGSPGLGSNPQGMNMNLNVPNYMSSMPYNQTS